LANDEDHHRAVAAAIRKPPSDWKRHPGRPNHAWLRAIEQDLKPLNIGPSDTWKKASSREHWRSIVDTATLKKYVMPRREKETLCEGGICYGPVSAAVTSRSIIKTDKTIDLVLAPG